MHARHLVAVGLALATVGLVVPGLHHVRCSVTLAVADDGGASTMSAPCVETFPIGYAFAAAGLGLVGAVLVVVGGVSLLRSSEPGPGVRGLALLAGVALLAPPLLTLLGWASVGFDLANPQPQPGGGRWCSGDVGARPPLWLQTATCVEPVEVALPPLLALGGALSLVAVARASRRFAAAGLACAALAALAVVAQAALAADLPGLVWAVPLLATALLATLVVRAPGGAWAEPGTA